MVEMYTINVLALTFPKNSADAVRFGIAYKCVENPEMELVEIEEKCEKAGGDIITYKFRNSQGEFDTLITEFDGKNLHVHVGIEEDCRLASVIPVSLKSIISYTAEY